MQGSTHWDHIGSMQGTIILNQKCVSISSPSAPLTLNQIIPPQSQTEEANIWTPPNTEIQPFALIQVPPASESAAR